MNLMNLVRSSTLINLLLVPASAVRLISDRCRSFPALHSRFASMMKPPPDFSFIFPSNIRFKVTSICHYVAKKVERRLGIWMLIQERWIGCNFIIKISEFIGVKAPNFGKYYLKIEWILMISEEIRANFGTFGKCWFLTGMAELSTYIRNISSDI